MKRFVCIFLSLTVAVVFFVGVCACKNNKNVGVVKCGLSVEYSQNKIFGSVNYSNYKGHLIDEELLFNLYPNKIYNMSEGIKILSVKMGGKIVDFSLLGDNSEYLSVKNCNGSEILIEFETLVLSGNGRLACFEGGANLAYFFPHIVPVTNSRFKKLDYVDFGDAFFDVFCDFCVDITIPSVMALATGGKPAYCNVMGEKTTYGYTLLNAKTFAFCINENFGVVSKKWGNKSINYYYFDDSLAQKRVDDVILALDFFKKTIGEYQYDNFTLCQTNFKSGGMEYPAFCILGQNENQLEYSYALIHEIAHQYFPISVDFNQYENAFMDEGFAEYLAMKFLQANDFKRFSERLFLINASVNAFDKAVKSGKTHYKSSAFRSLNEFSCEYEYVQAVYRKGFLAFYQVEKQLGEKNFLKGVKKFYKNNLAKNSTVKEFFNAFCPRAKRVENLFLKSLS